MLNIIFVTLIFCANCVNIIESSELAITQYKNVTLDMCGLNHLSSAHCCKKCIKWHSTIKQQVYPPKGKMTRVLGGRFADEGEFPFTVKLTKIGEMDTTCTGVILNQRWIITAAHCLGDALRVKVYVGHTDFPRDEDSYYNSSLLKMYDLYDHYINPIYSYQYDIGLIKLNKSLPITNRINSICLPNHSFRNDQQELALFSGWGMISENTPNLQRLKVGTVSLSLDTMPYLTATNINSGIGCHADSGSPLIQYVNGRAVLIGVFTGINPPPKQKASCIPLGHSMTFARVADYVHWIYKTVNENK